MHWPSLLTLIRASSLGLIIHSPMQVIPASIAVPPSYHSLKDSLMHIMSLHRYRSWDLQFQPHIHLLAGAWPLPQLHLSVQSKVLQGIQQATCKVYRHAQDMFLQSCHHYGLLQVPTDQETLMCFTTFLADAKGLQHGTIFRYLYRVRALHISMGLSDPLKGTLWLHKGL